MKYLEYETEVQAEAKIAELNEYLGYPMPDGGTETSVEAVKRYNQNKWAVPVCNVDGTKYAQEEYKCRPVDVENELLSDAERAALIDDISDYYESHED